MPRGILTELWKEIPALILLDNCSDAHLVGIASFFGNRISPEAMQKFCREHEWPKRKEEREADGAYCREPRLPVRGNRFYGDQKAMWPLATELGIE